jgi:hypothetical protein
MTNTSLTTGAPATTRRFTAWPLLISACGLLGLVAILLESRPDNSSDFKHPFTAAALADVDPVPYRISCLLGYLLVLLLLATAAVWRQRVERRFTGSVGAAAVTLGVAATAALVALSFGWRGAVGDYFPGGPEDTYYDTEGLYNYFILTDFSPYIAFVPLLGSAYGLAWMAFAERLVSRGLGAAAGLVATGLLLAVAVTGVPGLPFAIVLALVVAGVWLAFGRSAITQAER